MEDVRETLAEIDAASERLTATAAKLTDRDLGEPSRLPGWTRGHVLAHLIRNTDSCWNLLEWARTGVEVPQYPSDAARDAGVETNAGRPIAELRAELRVAVERFALQAGTMPASAWPVMIRARAGWPHPAWFVLNRRWRELEAHHLDLAFGYTHTDWPRAYVEWELTDTLGAVQLDGGLAAGRVRATDMDVDVSLGEGSEVSAPGHELLGWLTGRGGSVHEEWPAAPSAWPLPTPGWRPS
ncbi:maleylpyruvate isomerase family mycothiol-dependent enzyme [Actinomadura sp. DC4]|uniref:maleylpyruvate isomerase family mycothiol-dependent enzyme n=1 Tax=Actinomadura sp. DC4 TaxID=3055069 RepID=UPI0025B0F575|nr:maleylpyruvate isomerase family mycothiol-dependent enzyme [Actinomadura sp. DC4]MDN3351482.1 maleylpyruvate isomerase family mycothiol-dependent enzyme [Actinomadura sp. DC4]